MAMTPVSGDGGWSAVLETLALPDTAMLASGSWQRLSPEGALGPAGPRAGTRGSRGSRGVLLPLLGSLLSPLRKGGSGALWLLTRGAHLHHLPLDCLPCPFHAGAGERCAREPWARPSKGVWIWSFLTVGFEISHTEKNLCCTGESTAKCRLVAVSTCWLSFPAFLWVLLHTLCFGVRVKSMRNLYQTGIDILQSWYSVRECGDWTSLISCS